MTNYITIVNTNFPQADGPLNPAQWTTLPGTSAMAVASHLAEASVNNTPCAAFWSADSFPLVGNQWCEAALHQLGGNTANFVDIFILTSEPSVLGGFFAEAVSNGNGTIGISLFDNTSELQIGPTFNVTFVVDAILRVEFINGVVTMKYNGVTIESIGGLSSHNSDSGPPGMFVGTADVVTNATVSHFSAGTIVPSSGSSELDFGFRFKF